MTRARVLLVLLCLTLGCAAPVPRWRSGAKPTPEQAALLLEPRGASRLAEGLFAAEIAEIPVRERLRLCCAFGSDIRAEVASVPVPGYQIDNILDPQDIGKHKYDSGALTVHGEEDDYEVALDAEHNGLVYTCRGGFIDTAHVRDYVDWSVFMVSWMGRHLHSGGELALPSEGGERRLILKPATQELLDHVGWRRLLAWLTTWMGYQMSVWHEIATWYGWSTMAVFSERASAFSPEDLYSNQIGARLIQGIIYRFSGGSDEFIYNRSVDAWFRLVLENLGPVPKQLGRDVAIALDGHWWDSTKRVPDPTLVLRRNFDFGDPVTPWVAPDSALPPELRKSLDAACDGNREPLPLRNASRRRDVEFSDWLTLEIQVDDQLAGHEPFSGPMGRTVTQRDFPAIVEVIREQNLREFGAGSDRPD